jgi:hypothetical protein
MRLRDKLRLVIFAVIAFNLIQTTFSSSSDDHLPLTAGSVIFGTILVAVAIHLDNKNKILRNPLRH